MTEREYEVAWALEKYGVSTTGENWRNILLSRALEQEASAAILAFDRLLLQGSECALFDAPQSVDDLVSFIRSATSAQIDVMYDLDYWFGPHLASSYTEADSDCAARTVGEVAESLGGIMEEAVSTLASARRRTVGGKFDELYESAWSILEHMVAELIDWFTRRVPAEIDRTVEISRSGGEVDILELTFRPSVDTDSIERLLVEEPETAEAALGESPLENPAHGTPDTATPGNGLVSSGMCEDDDAMRTARFVVNSETYGSMVPPSRLRPDDSKAIAVLATLIRAGGTVSFSTLSRATGSSLLRIAGLLATMERLVNVDGFPVLTTSASLQEARLNDRLLRSQFPGCSS